LVLGILNNGLGQKLIAEAVGTFFLTFLGAGSAVAAAAVGGSPLQGLIVAALGNGLALAIAVSATMSVSGGSINPAVTLALFISKRISGGTAFLYAVSELVGAIVAAFILRATLPNQVGSSVLWGTPTVASSVSLIQGTIIEAIMTFILVFVVFGTAVDPRAPKIGGFGIGLAVTSDVLIGGPFTGAAMNPAREIGPALASGFLNNWYVYWVGDLAGATLAAIVYGYLILGHYQSGH
jgi:MIP family channel proteins